MSLIRMGAGGTTNTNANQERKQIKSRNEPRERIETNQEKKVKSEEVRPCGRASFCMRERVVNFTYHLCSKFYISGIAKVCSKFYISSVVNFTYHV